MVARLDARGHRRLLPLPLVVVLAVALLLASTERASAGKRSPPAPPILPPGQEVMGQSLDEWAANWWTWAMGEGFYTILDDTGALCAQGQSGDVWFLAGAWGTVTRECTVPYGRLLFLPVQNNVFIGFPDDPWPFAPYADEADARAGLAAGNDASGGRSATIDGLQVGDLDAYRVQSPVFDAYIPLNNAFGLPEMVSSPDVDDGWYLFVRPLSSGSHTIHFTGWDGGLDVTYHLTVPPASKR